MSYEDKMRDEFADFDAGFTSNDEIYRAAVFGWDSGVEACTTIKDAEIASRDLMIKELRATLALLRHKIYNEEEGAFEVVDMAYNKSEHHNSRALEKMLLEAELEGARSSTPALRALNICEKLAELNKE